MEGYISIREAAEKWGVSERRINQYCSEGRIPGAERFGTSWAIPESAEKPGDPRKQNQQQTLPLQVCQKFHGLFLHQISLALAGADQIRQSGCLQLAPQAADIDAQSVFIYKAVGFPQPGHQRLPADRLALALQQHL